MSLLDHRHVDAESATHARSGAKHVDTATVVLFHDSFGQGKSQTPAAALGREAGVENRFEILSGYA